MVQGLPGTTYCKGPFDAIRKVMKTEGLRGLYRGFGLTVLTQPPASALWWGAYGAAQHIIWRYIFYCTRLLVQCSSIDLLEYLKINAELPSEEKELNTGLFLAFLGV